MTDQRNDDTKAMLQRIETAIYSGTKMIKSTIWSIVWLYIAWCVFSWIAGAFLEFIASEL